MEASPPTPPAMVACPVCGRLFKDSHGRGGHLATLNDEAHAAYREARSNPQAAATAPATLPDPQSSQPYDLPAFIRDLAALQADASAREASQPEPAVDSSSGPSPETLNEGKRSGPGMAIAGLLGGAFALAALVQSRRAAPSPQGLSQAPARPSEAPRSDAEAYWASLLGSAALTNRRTRFP